MFNKFLYKYEPFVINITDNLPEQILRSVLSALDSGSGPEKILTHPMFVHWLSKTQTLTWLDYPIWIKMSPIPESGGQILRTILLQKSMKAPIWTLFVTQSFFSSDLLRLNYLHYVCETIHKECGGVFEVVPQTILFRSQIE